MNRYILTFALRADKDAPAVIDTITVDAVNLEAAEYAGFDLLMQRHPDRFTLGCVTHYTKRLIICGSALAGKSVV